MQAITVYQLDDGFFITENNGSTIDNVKRHFVPTGWEPFYIEPEEMMGYVFPERKILCLHHWTTSGWCAVSMYPYIYEQPSFFGRGDWCDECRDELMH